MKKLIFVALTFLLFSQAHALTLQECARYSDADIGKMLLNSIALCGQTGSGNRQCMEEAKKLDVAIVGDEFSEVDMLTVQSENDFTIDRIEPASEENMFRPVVHYVIRKRDGTRVEGEFAFKRHKSFMDPTSINTRKCASITNPATVMFMLNSCK